MRGRLFSSVNFSLLFTNRREKRNVILQPLEASFDLYQNTKFIEGWNKRTV